MHRSRLASFWVDVPADRFEAERRFWTEGLGYGGREATQFPGTYYMLGTWDHVAIGLQRIGDALSYLPAHQHEPAVESVDAALATELRWHVDFCAEDVAATTKCAEAAGARVEHRFDDWVRLVDPAGLPFCIVPGVQLGVWLDIPVEQFDTVAAFWSGALGRAITSAPHDPGFFGLGAAGASLTIGIQRLGSGPARWHVDIESDDVADEVARLESLGAKATEAVETWQKLRDPAGQEFCVTQVQTEGFADATTWP